MTERQQPISTGLRLYTVNQVAASFWVTPRTVQRWVHDGLIRPRYRLRGGTCYQLAFLESEVMRFVDENLPTPEDLDPSHKPRSRKKLVETIRRLRNMNRLYAGKATAARMAKQSGVLEDDRETEEEPEAEREPVILDRRPTRRRSQDETPCNMEERSHGEDREDGKSDRTLGEDRETEEQ